VRIPGNIRCGPLSPIFCGLCVCLSFCWTYCRDLQNCWTNWDTVLDVGLWGPGNHVLDGGPYPPLTLEGASLGNILGQWHACACLWYIYSAYSALFIRQHNVSAAVSILYFTCLYRDCLASWLQKTTKFYFTLGAAAVRPLAALTPSICLSFCTEFCGDFIQGVCEIPLTC